ncbi:MAG: hypothetical protein REH83_04390 [Rickettsiella sp.]|nr:hypothetical protein [Rickettsiella sp.]
MDKNKVPFNSPPCPAPESSDSEPLCLRLAKAHAASSYANVNKKYLGDATPIYVDKGQ